MVRLHSVPWISNSCNRKVNFIKECRREPGAYCQEPHIGNVTVCKSTSRCESRISCHTCDRESILEIAREANYKFTISRYCISEAQVESVRDARASDQSGTGCYCTLEISANALWKGAKYNQV